MKENDIVEEIIEMGRKRGTLTADEINEILSTEFYPPEEVEEVLDLLQDMGVKVTDTGSPASRLNSCSISGLWRCSATL